MATTLNLKKSWWYTGFFLKLLAAIFLWLIYTYYYTDRATADIYKYFDDAVYLFETTKGQLQLRWQLIFGIAEQSPKMEQLISGTLHWDSATTFILNDNRTITRIHLILLHLSNGFYFLHLLFFSLVSFIGSFGIFRFFNRFSSVSKELLFIICFFIPSFLLWTSAPLKESWLVSGLGVFLWGFSAILTRIKKENLLLVLAGFLILLSLKLYILVSLIPALFFFMISKKSNRLNLIFLIIHLVLLLLLFLTGESIITSLSSKQREFQTLLEQTNANSGIELSSFYDFWTLLQTLPQAFFNVFLKPILPNNWNPFSLMTSLEHLLFLILTLLPFLFYKKQGIEDKRLLLFCLSFVLITGAIIGLTTPILGAIVRYKAPILPFYLLILITFIDFNKLKKFLKIQ